MPRLDRNPDFPHVCPNIETWDRKCAICRWLNEREFLDQFYAERREIEREQWAKHAEFTRK